METTTKVFDINPHCPNPNIDINDISHDSALDPNSITTEMILNKIKNFI